MSGNPFRRSQPAPAPPPAVQPASLRRHDPTHPPAADQKPPARTKKHVRVASPPPEPSSPEMDDHVAARFGAAWPAAPPPRHPPPSVDSSDSPGRFAHAPSDGKTAGQDSPDDAAPPKPAASDQLPSGDTLLRASGIPNPFERTLASIEPSIHPSRDESEETGSLDGEAAGLPLGDSHRPKGAMDVDSFKQLLMTGSADKTPSDGTTLAGEQPRSDDRSGGDSSSGTGGSSAFRNSMSDSVPQIHAASPRRPYDGTSWDGSNGADQSTPVGAEPAREKPKPPPPKHRHGKSITRAPQTVSFSDFSPSLASPAAKTDLPRRTPSVGQRPLPPRPRVPSGQKQKDATSPPPPPIADTAPATAEVDTSVPSDGEKENSPPEKTAEPSAPQRRKPPTPPLARRYSQLKSSDARSRSNSAAMLSSQAEAPPLSPAEQNPATSAAAIRPPPPPPTRRSGASSSGIVDPIPNALSRSSSRRSTASSMHNPPLNVRTNRLSGSALDMASPTGGGGGPPPPPPRRGSSKSSFEMQRPSASVLAAAVGEGRRSSGEYKSRSRTASGASERAFGGYILTEEEPPADSNGGVGAKAAGGNAAGGMDLLSELDKLQKEVEALRQKSTTKT